jgi:hypothetical protein
MQITREAPAGSGLHFGEFLTGLNCHLGIAPGPGDLESAS